MVHDLSVTREIAPGAEVSADASIGPFCVIGPEVKIRPGTVLAQRVTVIGRTVLGRDNDIAPGCVLGAPPQDLKYRGRPTWLIVGDRNVFRANVTAHVGTEAGGYLTRIGDDNVLAGGAHVAHDCYVDDRTRLGVCVMLAGHVRVETGAVVGDYTGAHHFTTIGAYARVEPRTPVRRDVPPYTIFSSLGYYNAPTAFRGVHEQGLAAAGLSDADCQAVRQAVRHLFQDEQALAVKLEEMSAAPDPPQPVAELLAFCRRVLAGTFGRCREAFRGRMPPEALCHLPPEAMAEIEGNPPR
ncbi:MAG TPA: acyl-ACP--UDP-N-acetylglucosamine O-acyltransferase [Phycisphaerae bacterium]|nr:acyl-ACP--UDP-N-acetylglucosamine O-acyltransferase [Phycisphaerae bacterium]